jgi:hypothetical protein
MSCQDVNQSQTTRTTKVQSRFSELRQVGAYDGAALLKIAGVGFWYQWLLLS